MSIVRYFDFTAEPEPLFREAWVVPADGSETETADLPADAPVQFVINHGTMGHESATQAAESVTAAEGLALLEAFGAQCEEDGFAPEADAPMHTLIVQYRLKTREGTERDSYFEGKAVEALNHYFAWRGLGVITEVEHGAYRLNLVVATPDLKRAVKGAKIALRDWDPTKMTLATAKAGTESFTQVHPTHGGAFSRLG